MTALELCTRAAILLLVGGSMIIFAWFVKDLARLERTWRKDEGHGDRVAREGADPAEQPFRSGGGER